MPDGAAKLPGSDTAAARLAPGPEDTADWPRNLAQAAADSGAEILTTEAGDSYSLGGRHAADFTGRQC